MNIFSFYFKKKDVDFRENVILIQTETPNRFYSRPNNRFKAQSDGSASTHVAYAPLIVSLVWQNLLTCDGNSGLKCNVNGKREQTKER